MGFFDLFKAKGSGDAKAKSAKEEASDAARWAERAADKRAQNVDRQEAISALSEMRTKDAAAALLKRFTFTIDPSITDEEEKDLAFQGILAAGEKALEPVRAFVQRAESVAWPMRIAKELLEEEAFVDELLSWLEPWDTEYAKFIDPKLQILAALEEHKGAKIREAVEPFLADVNEEARFAAVATTFAQDDAEAMPALVQTLIDEESFRIKNKLADGFASKEWTVSEDLRPAARKALPPGFSIDGDGIVRKHA